jgi:cardiolipin synthase
MSKKLNLLLPYDYVKDATEKIRLSKNRVSFLSMILTEDTSTNGLITELSEAAKRGVNVEVAADIFTYGELGGTFLPIKYYSSPARKTLRLSKNFRKNGVNFTWLGRTRSTIFNGRTHIKWCIVDDTVYSFGGVNLYDKGVGNTDYMFKINDKKLADKLVAEYRRLKQSDAKGYAYRSHSVSHELGEVLIDGGIYGDSIIYRRACKLAKEASDVLLVSQYCPTGKLGRLLKKTNSRLYFNPPKNISFINKIVISFGMFFSGHRTLYEKPNYLHAKFMIFTMPNGEKIAITGSHNFVYGGVLLGTREISLQTKDKHIIEQLETFFRDHVEKPKTT